MVKSDPIALSPQTSSRNTQYAAPEVVEGKGCLKSDVWSLGLAVLELAEGKNPFGVYRLCDVMNGETCDVMNGETCDVMNGETCDVMNDKTYSVMNDKTHNVMNDKTHNVMNDKTHNVMNDEKRDESVNTLGSLSSHWASDLTDFVSRCLVKDVEKRASVEELMRVRYGNEV